MATLVLVSHASVFLSDYVTSLSLGNVGVFSFFILSGFVISEALDCFYRNNIKGFLLNRFLKIYPAYWGATVLAVLILTPFDLTDVSLTVWSVIVNFSMLLGHIPAGNNLLIVTVVWAVIIEVHLYVLAGITHSLGERFGRAAFAMAVAGTLSLIAYIYVDYTESFMTAHGVFRHAPYFVMGSAYYYFYKSPGLCSSLFTIVALLLSVHSYVTYLGGSGEANITASVFLFIVVNIIFARLAFVRVGSRLENIDKRLGDLTYALYLVHMPVIVVIKHMALANSTSFILSVLLSVVAATLIFYSVEKPIGYIRDRVRGIRLYS